MIIACAVALTVLLLLVGATTTKVDAWYRDLRKPRWTPPNWLFGPAWTIILALACWSGVLLWSASSPEHRWRVGLAFGCNAVFHLIWSPVFFRLKRPDWALLDVAFLWSSIIAMMLVAQPVSTVALWLLAPYLLWVSYAAALNFAIVKLNRAAQPA